MDTHEPDQPSAPIPQALPSEEANGSGPSDPSDPGRTHPSAATAPLGSPRGQVRELLDMINLDQ
jgi:hypothetical protein